MRLITKTLFCTLLGAMPLIVHGAETPDDLSSVATGSFDEGDQLIPFAPALTPEQQEMQARDSAHRCNECCAANCGKFAYCATCIAVCYLSISRHYEAGDIYALMCLAPAGAACAVGTTVMVCLECYDHCKRCCAACCRRRSDHHHE